MLEREMTKEVIIVLKCHLNQLKWLSLSLSLSLSSSLNFWKNKNPILNCNDAREESQE